MEIAGDRRAGGNEQKAVGTVGGVSACNGGTATADSRTMLRHNLEEGIILRLVQAQRDHTQKRLSETSKKHRI